METEKPAGEKKHLRRSAALLALATIIFLTATWEANALKDNVGIKDVRVSGTRLLSAKDVIALAAIDRSQKLYALDINAVRRRVETNPYVESAEIIRDVRGNIMIVVHERVPVVAVVNDKTVYLDDSARVLPQVQSTQVLDLPLLTGSMRAEDFVPGKKVHNESVLRALGLLDTARAFGDDLYHRISEVHVAGDGALVCYTAESGIPVAFGQGGVAVKLAKLDGFWKQYVAREGAQALNYIDLRFDDIVVARWNQQQEPALDERVNP